MPKLDGSETQKDLLTPFDSHDQKVRAPHTYSPEKGYEAAEYEHQEYPKVIAHEETGETIVAKDAEHEAKLKAEKASE